MKKERLLELAGVQLNEETSSFVKPLAIALRNRVVEIAKEENYEDIEKNFGKLFRQAMKDIQDEYWETLGEMTEALL